MRLSQEGPASPAESQDLPQSALALLLLVLALVCLVFWGALSWGRGKPGPDPRDEGQFPTGKADLRILGRNGKGYREVVNQVDGSILIRIPAGAFVMGTDDQEAYENEKPLRSVALDDYYIGRHPVTNEQFQRFVDATGYEPFREDPGPSPRPDPSAPVVYITWQDAFSYCRWAGLRLPTEEEWEKAARGEDGRRYPWGNTLGSRLAWHDGNSGGQVRKVGGRPLGASPYGCLDMAGNVWEWCAGWYGPYPGSVPPRSEDDQDLRPVRGGSWSSGPGSLRTTVRVGVSPGPLDAYANLGFRVALSASGSAGVSQATPQRKGIAP